MEQNTASLAAAEMHVGLPWYYKRFPYEKSIMTFGMFLNNQSQTWP